MPTGALWQQGQGSAVWLFDAASGSVKAQPVVVATADGNQAVIASGLKGGEQVVVAGVITAVIAVNGAEEVLTRPATELKTEDDKLLPAMQGRNHAATPRN